MHEHELLLKYHMKNFGDQRGCYSPRPINRSWWRTPRDILNPSDDTKVTFILRCHQRLPQEMTSEKQLAQKFHTDDTSLPRSGLSAWLITSLKFLCSFLGCHFAGRPLVTSRNIGCFLRLLPHEVSEMSCHFVLTTKTTQPRPQLFLVNCPVFCQLCCRIDIIFHVHCIWLW